MSNRHPFDDIVDNFQLYFASQNVLNGISLLNTNNSFIGIAYGVYDAFTDTLTLYDFVTDTPVGRIYNYGFKFSYLRVKRHPIIMYPNIFTRFYYGEGSYYGLSQIWYINQFYGDLIPSCADFLLILSNSIVTLSYLIYNGHILPSEDVQNVYYIKHVLFTPSTLKLDFNVSFAYSIPQYGYPSCRTSILVRSHEFDDRLRYPYDDLVEHRFDSEAVITQASYWYAPLILSDIGIYGIRGFNFYFAKIGGLYSPYDVCFFSNDSSIHHFYIPNHFYIPCYYSPARVLHEGSIYLVVDLFRYPSGIAVGLPYEFQISHAFKEGNYYRITFTTKSLWNYTPPFFNVSFLSTNDVPSSLFWVGGDSTSLNYVFGSNIIL